MKVSNTKRRNNELFPTPYSPTRTSLTMGFVADVIIVDCIYKPVRVHSSCSIYPRRCRSVKTWYLHTKFRDDLQRQNACKATCLGSALDQVNYEAYFAKPTPNLLSHEKNEKSHSISLQIVARQTISKNVGKPFARRLALPLILQLRFPARGGDYFLSYLRKLICPSFWREEAIAEFWIEVTWNRRKTIFKRVQQDAAFAQ